MVYLLATDATICCILDSLLQQQCTSLLPHSCTFNCAAESTKVSPQTPNPHHLRRDLLHRYCVDLRETILPSQLHNALWLTLLLRYRVLTTTATSAQTEATAAVAAASAVNLPPGCVLHTNEDACEQTPCERRVFRSGLLSESMRQYRKHTTLEALLRERYTYRRSHTASDAVLGTNRNDAAGDAGARVGALPHSAAANSMLPGPDDRRRAIDDKLLETLSLQRTNGRAPASASNPNETMRSGCGRRSSIVPEHLLLQPRWMVYIIDTLETLWCVLALCRWLKRLQEQRTQWLLSESVIGSRGKKSTSTHTSSYHKDGARCYENGRERDEDDGAKKEETHHIRDDGDTFFHDYALLLPLPFVQQFLASLRVQSALTGDSVRCLPSLSLTALLRLCCIDAPDTFHSAKPSRHAVNHTTATNISHGSDSSGDNKESRTDLCTTDTGRRRSIGKDSSSSEYRHCSVKIIINPATSSRSHNPGRAAKNKRVDIIDNAVQDYHYHNKIALCHTRSAGGATGLHESMRNSNSSSSISTCNGSSNRVSVIDPQRIRSGWASEARERGESYASFVQSISIGFDIQLMALTGAVVGYYLGYIRGGSTEVCISYGAIGLVAMLLVDATLLIIRVGRSDAALRQQRKGVLRQRRKLMHSSQGGRSSHEGWGSGGACCGGGDTAMCEQSAESVCDARVVGMRAVSGAAKNAAAYALHNVTTNVMTQKHSPDQGEGISWKKLQ